MIRVRVSAPSVRQRESSQIDRSPTCTATKTVWASPATAPKTNVAASEKLGDYGSVMNDKKTLHILEGIDDVEDG